MREMAEPRIAPYGSWKSPVTTDAVVSATIRLTGVALDHGDIYWIEGRPTEGGRHAIVKCSGNDGTISDVIPQSFNARTLVHEYGGGSYAVHEGTIYFSNFSDQRLYRVRSGEEPVPITEPGERRYADGTIDGKRRRLICICEDHTNKEREAVNTLVSVALDGSKDVYTLVSGNDFYSSPRLSPDGSRLAWLTWNHPNMPWDGCELWVGDLDAHGYIVNVELVAGGPQESIFQPRWSPDGTLYFVSDRSGWWNIYRQQEGRVEAVCPMEAEFGQPQWIFDRSSYAFVSPQRIICQFDTVDGNHLAFLDTKTGQLSPISVPYTDIDFLQANESHAVFIGASPTQNQGVVELKLDNQQHTLLKSAGSAGIDPAYISVAQPIEFPTEQGQTAYAYYYAPRNPDYRAPEGELPPLLVNVHGGPTSAAPNFLSWSIQFWTSRGFAFLNVNYGGSTGYGRAYRERLKGQWGIVDVDDSINGAEYLIERGLADPQRIAIRGGSAGGYTTLCAVTFRDFFTAGASYFGVSDLDIFAGETHKYESRYLFGLVGPYPEQRDLYIQRSAINFIDQVSCPVIFFQGLEDKIVPPNQADIMFNKLKAKQVPVAYLPFEGEQHGFRRAANIKRSLEAELYFYSKIFHFALAERIEPVEIANLH
jgi:dipeptidyl aminopeptidase/acylaminoacyl peptidase